MVPVGEALGLISQRFYCPTFDAFRFIACYKIHEKCHLTSRNSRARIAGRRKFASAKPGKWTRPRFRAVIGLTGVSGKGGDRRTTSLSKHEFLSGF